MYKKDKVNIVMPVYNEQATLEEIITRTLAQKMVDKLVIVDDNSRDKSPDIIKKLAKKDSRIVYLKNESNKGKGYSVRKGLAQIKSGIIIIQDADLEYYPEDYAKMVPKVSDDTFVLGSRIRLKEKGGHTYRIAVFVNDVLTNEFNLLYGKNSTDINTCYKVFKKEMLGGVTLEQDGFLIDPEIILALVKKGYKVVDVDVRYKGRTYAEGKKITAKDGIEQFLFIFVNKFKQ
jgi:glycosyltransferase involved in cell wall biosynthesis